MNYKSLIFYFGVFLLLGACNDPNQEFEVLKNNFDRQKHLYFLAQADATPSLQVFDSLRINQIGQLLVSYRDSLSEIPQSKLIDQHQKDYTEIHQFLAKAEQDFIQDQLYSWDPSFYNVYPHFEKILAIENITPKDKLNRLEKMTRILPAHYQAAIQNIKQASILGVKPAKEDLFKIYHFLKYSIFKWGGKVDLKLTDQTEFMAARTNAIFAIKDYLAFCKSLEFEYREDQSAIVFRDSL